MKKLLLVLLLIAAPVFGQTSADNQLLVTPRAHVSNAALEATYKGVGATKVKILTHDRTHVISVAAGTITHVEASLRNNKNVELVERNFTGGGELIPNDTSYSSQWHLTKIEAPLAWDTTTGSAGVPVAVIDSGIDTAHSDLKSKIAAGWSFLTDTTNVQDTGALGGHGTAISGAIAAASNNASGVAGVAWLNPIMPLVVLTAGNVATAADISDAIVWAADHGAKIINISLGLTGYSTTMQNAINYAYGAGATIFAAAGNGNTSTPLYPAAMNNVVAVGATDQSDAKASFSNFGSWIDIVAPGVTILTTQLGGGYWNTQGTSLSSPIAAGIGALMLSINTELSQSDLYYLLIRCAADLGTLGFDNTFGWGRVKAGCSVVAATPPTPPQPCTPPQQGC